MIILRKKTQKITFLALMSCLIAAMWGMNASESFAQRAYKVSAFANGPASMQTREGVIQLWGLDADALSQTKSRVRAQVKIDDLIGSEDIECTAVRRDAGRVIARCLNVRGEDIALELVKDGLAIIDRSQLAGTQALDTYSNAQQRARIAGSGVWAELSAAQSKQTDISDTISQAAVGFQAKDILLIAAAFLGPLIGMLVICAVLYFGFDRMIKLQKRQMALSQQKEKDLRDREKFVLAASLESEINTNRAKIDAFLVIYEDMLRTMKDPKKTPKYQQSGDIIHQRPSLSRAVYDANLDRMDLLGPQLFSDLSEIYAKINPDADYITLEPDMPIEQAMDKVQKVITQANEMIAPMDKADSALSMIIRERKKKIPQPQAFPDI